MWYIPTVLVLIEAPVASGEKKAPRPVLTWYNVKGSGMIISFDHCVQIYYGITWIKKWMLLLCAGEYPIILCISFVVIKYTTYFLILTYLILYLMEFISEWINETNGNIIT
jgi:hypothetical protein